MTKLSSRLLRHLSFANLVACMALFIALGGVGYAAATINGNAIVKRTIGAGKLKNGTLTSTQVKQDGLTGSVIQESTLATVPSAQTAVSAQTATTAATAATATSAEAAEEAATLDGLSAEELQVSCPADTSLFGGMCWDDDLRPGASWIAASVECGEAGGRLPSLSELIAYVLQPGAQATEPHWSADVVDLPGSEEHVLTRSDTATGSSEAATATIVYRCLFYRTN